MIHAIARILSVGGMRAELFLSAEDLLATETAQLADCLVVDIRLPGTSGFGLIRELLNRGVVRPVIFITSQDEQAVRDEAQALGARGFLSKPFGGRKLLESIRAAVDV